MNTFNRSYGNLLSLLNQSIDSPSKKMSLIRELSPFCINIQVLFEFTCIGMVSIKFHVIYRQCGPHSYFVSFELLVGNCWLDSDAVDVAGVIVVVVIVFAATVVVIGILSHSLLLIDDIMNE